MTSQMWHNCGLQEKYGPKGVIKGGSGSTQKVQKEQKPNTADIDLSIGLALKPPWACR